jgi:hypothetical protein
VIAPVNRTVIAGIHINISISSEISTTMDSVNYIRTLLALLIYVSLIGNQTCNGISVEEDLSLTPQENRLLEKVMFGLLLDTLQKSAKVSQITSHFNCYEFLVQMGHGWAIASILHENRYLPDQMAERLVNMGALKTYIKIKYCKCIGSIMSVFDFSEWAKHRFG